MNIWQIIFVIHDSIYVPTRKPRWLKIIKSRKLAVCHCWLRWPYSLIYGSIIIILKVYLLNIYGSSDAIKFLWLFSSSLIGKIVNECVKFPASTFIIKIFDFNFYMLFIFSYSQLCFLIQYIKKPTKNYCVKWNLLIYTIIYCLFCGQEITVFDVEIMANQNAYRCALLMSSILMGVRK